MTAGLLLLVLGAVLAAAQVRAGHTRAVSSGFLQETMLYPSSQPQGTLTVPAADGAGPYSIYLALPGGAAPGDYGIAFHEVRRYLSVSVANSAQGPSLRRFPNTTSETDLPDQMGANQAIEVCTVEPADKPLVASCRLEDGPPWPESIRIGIAHSTPHNSGHQLTLGLAHSSRPYVYGASAVLLLVGLALTRRGLVKPV